MTRLTHRRLGSVREEKIDATNRHFELQVSSSEKMNADSADTSKSSDEEHLCGFDDFSAPSLEQQGKAFCSSLTHNPTVFHFVSSMKSHLQDVADFKVLNERDAWNIQAGGKYLVTRNNSSMIAFTVGKDYKPGNGLAIIAAHADALTAKVKPISKLNNTAGYEQLGVAPYAGGLNNTWWDRDLGIAGRVIVKDSDGKVSSRLVNLNEPIARIPTLAPHFGAVASGPYNPETQMVPIIGLEENDRADHEAIGSDASPKLGTFASTQPTRLVKAIAGQLGLEDTSHILSWELELYDIQPAQFGGLDKEFIYGGRLDDKLCSWASIQALASSKDDASSGIIKCVGLFDNEEIGSLLRQGARGNFLPSTIERMVQALAHSPAVGLSLLGQTHANSFLVSADNTHAVNPNFLNAYLPHHAPKLNVGLSISADPNGHMTTDAVSTALFQRIADKCESELQIFQIRNDVRSGGTVGPMLSSATGIRGIDAGIPQLSMHSIRATTGSKDPGLGVKVFKGFFDHYEETDLEFRNS